MEIETMKTICLYKNTHTLLITKKKKYVFIHRCVKLHFQWYSSNDLCVFVF